MATSTLRASVTSAASGLPEGAAVPLLVDGADSSCTANGLAGYTPTPGDRLLVQQVGGTLEVIQFISRGTVPYISGSDFAALSSTVSDLSATKTATWTQVADPNSTNPGQVGVNDEWVRPDQDNARYRWDGTTWTATLVGAAAMSQDILQGKVVPIGTQATLAWGVPDPASSLSGAIQAQGPETLITIPGTTTPYGISGLYREDATHVAFLRCNDSATSWPVKRMVTTTAAETTIGTLTNVGVTSQFPANTLPYGEYPGGVVKVNGDWWVLTIQHYTTSAFVDTLRWKVWQISGTTGAVLGTRIIKTSTDMNLRSAQIVPGSGSLVYGIAFYNASNRACVQEYTASTGATSGAQITSTTAVLNGASRYTYTDSGYWTYGDFPIAGASYDATWDIAAARYIFVFQDNAWNSPKTVVSMNTAGVIQAAEGWSWVTQSVGGDGFVGLAYDSTTARIWCQVNHTLSRFTTVTSDLARWAAYSWADTNATGGVHETAMSPTVSFTVPKRLLVTLSNLTFAPGANGTGTDDPRVFNLYMATTNGAPSVFHLDQQITYPTAKIIATGNVGGAQTALATSTFPTGSSGAIASQSGGFIVRGDGTGAWPLLTKTIIPAGAIMPFAGSTAPAGFYICDGSVKNTTTDAALFAVIGYAFGGSGTSFTLPDLRGRFPIGVQSGVYNLSNSGGATTHTITTAELPAHTHGAGTIVSSVRWNTNMTGGGTAKVVTDVGGVSGATNGTLSNAGTTGNTDNGTGGGSAMSILNPYLALNYIIRTGN